MRGDKAGIIWLHGGIGFRYNAALSFDLAVGSLVQATPLLRGLLVLAAS